MSTCALGKSPAGDQHQKEDLLIEKSLSRKSNTSCWS